MRLNSIFDLIATYGLGYWTNYWIAQDIFDFLWTGTIEDDELVDVSGNDNNIIITNKDFTGDYIPSDSEATFAIPDSATLKTDDTDLFWHDDEDNILQKTAEDLVATCYERTIVNYDNSDPYHVRWIGILKSTVTLSETQLNKLHKSFRLWILWSREINAYGYIKGNMPIEGIPIPISAEVTNTDRDKVVITFNQALDETSVPDASVFTIVGKTISDVLISDTNVILTVEEEYVFYDTGIKVTYEKPETNAIHSFFGDIYADSFSEFNVTNNISNPILDGDTICWYDYTDIETVVKNESNKISELKDKSGNDYHLYQTIEDKKPLYSETGILFDGSNDYLQTNAFGITYSQPLSIYIVMQKITHVSSDAIVTGIDIITCNTFGMISFMGHDVSLGDPSGYIYVTQLLAGVWAVCRGIWNGASSKVMVNDLIKEGSIAGVGTFTGLTLGSHANTSYNSNVEIKEVILRNKVDSEYDDGVIYNYLKSKYSI